VYACAKAKSFNKGFTSPRALSGGLPPDWVVRGWCSDNA
jgi:hypothetical protein